KLTMPERSPTSAGSPTCIIPAGGLNEPASVNDTPPSVETPTPVMLVTPPQPEAANCLESFHPTITVDPCAAVLGSFSVVSLSRLIELLSIPLTCTFTGGLAAALTAI